MTVPVPAYVETTYATLTGAGWPAVLDAELHDGSTLVQLEGTPDGGGARVVTSRRLPDSVPGYLRPFTPADGRVTQTDRWGPAADGVRRGTWSVTFPGSPAEMGGETQVEPAEGGSSWTVRGEVSVRIPLLGGRAESLLVPLLEKLVARQGEVLRLAAA